MPLDLTPLRHAQLFELLRQQNLSENTSARLQARGFARDQLDQDEAAMLRAMAVKSWSTEASVATSAAASAAASVAASAA